MFSGVVTPNPTMCTTHTDLDRRLDEGAALLRPQQQRASSCIIAADHHTVATRGGGVCGTVEHLTDDTSTAAAAASWTLLAWLVAHLCAQAAAIQGHPTMTKGSQ